MNQKCLLVGNGLNRTLNAGMTWDSVLASASQHFGVRQLGDIPLPMEFEKLVADKLSVQLNPSENMYEEFKKYIVSELAKMSLQADSVHHQLPLLKADKIITTNYDYLVQQSLDPNFKDTRKYPSGQKYLETVTSVINGTSMFHCHGILSTPQTLCLGYQHYAGILQRIRTRQHKKTADLRKKKQSRKNNIETQLSEQMKTWDDIFYTDDIAMLGFGLADSEIDFWWLITHRSYLYNANINDARMGLQNQIDYYDIVDDIPKELIKDEQHRYSNQLIQRKRHTLLRSLHVNVIPIKLSDAGGHFSDAYSQAIEMIDANWRGM